jgi:2'-5' RNA ligase
MPASTQPRRLFIGLMPDAAVRSALVAHRRAWYWPAGSRLVAAQRLHLTLHFLGDVDAPRQAALQAALALQTVEPLQLWLRTPQCWSGGVAVLRADAHQGLSALHARLGALLQGLGFATERRPFAPHVTLARDAPEAGPPDAAPAIAWTVTQLALVWSRRLPAPRYEVLARSAA